MESFTNDLLKGYDYLIEYKNKTRLDRFYQDIEEHIEVDLFTKWFVSKIFKNMESTLFKSKLEMIEGVLDIFPCRNCAFLVLTEVFVTKPKHMFQGTCKICEISLMETYKKIKNKQVKI